MVFCLLCVKLLHDSWAGPEDPPGGGDDLRADGGLDGAYEPRGWAWSEHLVEWGHGYWEGGGLDMGLLSTACWGFHLVPGWTQWWYRGELYVLC